MGTPKSGVIMMRVGHCMDRLLKRKTDLERRLKFTLTWTQFFEMVLNHLEELESHKKSCR